MLLSTSISYGLAFISVQEFESYKKEKKIRAKKMLSYFEKNNMVGDEFLQKGLFLPIGHINLGDYYVNIWVGEVHIPMEYEIKCEWSDFNLCVGSDNMVWAIGLGELENWNHNNYENKEYRFEENVFRFDPITKTDIPVDSYCGIRFTVPCGNYKAKVIGVKNKNDTVNSEGQYGYCLHLTPIEELTLAIDSTEIDFHRLNCM